jgi:hypothetical protein
MKEAKFWTLPVAISLVSLIVVGCARIQQLDPVTEAVKGGKVAGLPASSNYVVVGTVWSLPKLPSGPYSRISSLPVTVQKGTTNEGWYVFFCGKSEETKAWEIFSCMKWQTNSWQSVPVTLDKLSTK